jgi:hypothetical protein
MIQENGEMFNFEEPRDHANKWDVRALLLDQDRKPEPEQKGQPPVDPQAKRVSAIPAD